MALPYRELHGKTALHEAAWKGFTQTVSSLCQAKANVYMKNRGGFTALHLSCQSGHNQSCRILLLHGCRPDVKNNVSSLSLSVLTQPVLTDPLLLQYGDTPFHTAARYGHAGVIRILISAKCRVSEQNKVDHRVPVLVMSSLSFRMETPHCTSRPPWGGRS